MNNTKENTILNIKGNLVVKNLNKKLFQDDGIIIWVEGNIISECEMDDKGRSYGKFSRQSYINQETFPPIKQISTFTHQGD